MAEVFEARLEGPQQFSRACVIKRLRPELLVFPAQVALFLEEARLMARMQHPNLVSVFDLGEADGQYFLCMEKVEGPALSRLLEVLGKLEERLPIEVAAYIGARAAEGLHFAHELVDRDTHRPLHVVHRDVSPHNVLLGLAGDVKVTDFGIAKLDVDHRPVTQAGVTKGKLAYMAPEQARGAPVDRRTDVYALGVVLWESLTGRMLFADRDGRRRVEREGAPPPSSVRPEIDEALDAIVLGALRTHAKDRTPTARQLEEALDLWLSEHQTKSPRGALQRLLEANRGALASVESTAKMLPAARPPADPIDAALPEPFLPPESRTSVPTAGPASAPFVSPDAKTQVKRVGPAPVALASVFEEATRPNVAVPSVATSAPPNEPAVAARSEAMTSPERRAPATVVVAGRAAVPLPDAEAPPTQVPSPGTRFIGRGPELALLRAAFEDGARLVTLVGAGGTGKTRLALRFAEDAVRERAFPGGVRVVNATGLRDGMALMLALARALGMSLRGQLSPLEVQATVGRALSLLGRCLLVLDSAEQLAGRVDDVVADLARRAPRTRLLVTSQQVLGPPGERALEVPPLPVPDDGDRGVDDEGGAVELFLERARAARGGRALSDAARGVVAEIVRRLEGVPLAVEIAAARAVTETPAEILARLPRGDAIGTLKSAVDDTWAQLADDEKRAFRQASVFRGGFGLDAADAIFELGDDARARDVLERLKARSLLTSRGSGDSARYALLEALRGFATERLEEAGERVTTEARHAGYYVDLGRRLRTALDRHDAAAHKSLAIDAENLACIVERAAAAQRASQASATLALEAALALEPALSQRGTPADVAALLDKALPLAEARNVAPALLLRAHLARGDARRLAHAFDGARADLNAAIDLAASLKDTTSEGRAQMSLGALALSQGRREQAEGLLVRALALADAASDEATAGRTLALLGKTARLARRLPLAEERCRQAVERSQRAGDRRDEGRALVELSSTLLSLQRLDEAAHVARQAVLILERGDRRSLVHAWGTLAVVEVDRGSFDDGEAAAARAAELATLVGDRRAEGLYLGMRGACAHGRGQLLDARELYGQAGKTLLDLGEDAQGAFFMGALASVHAALDDLDEARFALGVAERRSAGADAPHVARAVALFGAVIGVAQAGDQAARGASLAAVRGALDAARDDAAHSEEVRFAARIASALR